MKKKTHFKFTTRNNRVWTCCSEHTLSLNKTAAANLSNANLFSIRNQAGEKIKRCD